MYLKIQIMKWKKEFHLSVSQVDIFWESRFPAPQAVKITRFKLSSNSINNRVSIELEFPFFSLQ